MNPSKICFTLSLLCFISFGLLFGASTLQAQNSKPIIPTEPLTSIYKQSLIAPLNKATSEVKDKDLAKFSQNLIQSYELDKQNSTLNSDDPSSLSNLLPDIAKINKLALITPLKEAGKLIHDKELSAFYYRFLSVLGIDK